MEAIAIIWAQRVYKALISIERRDLYIVLFSRHRLTIALLGEIKQELQRFQKRNQIGNKSFQYSNFGRIIDITI